MMNKEAQRIANQIKRAGLDAEDADGMVTELVEQASNDADSFDELAELVWNLLEDS